MSLKIVPELVITVPETASLSSSTSSPEIALLRDVIVAPALLVIVISCALLIFIPFELREIIEAGVSVSVDGRIIASGLTEPVYENSEVFLLQQLKGG